MAETWSEDIPGRGPPGRTRFAPAHRLSGEELAAEIAATADSPVVDALLRSTGTALFVLNDQRQVLAANTEALRMAGIRDGDAVLGLRPGEVLRCVHAEVADSGCGTGIACASCGAVIAVLLARRLETTQERRCAVAVRAGDSRRDLDLQARATAVALADKTLVVLALTDVGDQNRQAAMERAFLHDLANVITGLNAAAEAIASPDPGDAAEAAVDVRSISDRLAREVTLHRALATTDFDGYRPARDAVDVGRLLEDLRRLFQRHPVSTGRNLEFSHPGLAPIRTDEFLLARVLTNLVKNAFEATPDGGTVRLAVANRAGRVRFEVRNDGAIPPAVVPRIFQRHFTTKTGPGRGEGTWSVKLLGEELLRGSVGFATDPVEGTRFWLDLPA